MPLQVLVLVKLQMDMQVLTSMISHLEKRRLALDCSDFMELTERVFGEALQRQERERKSEEAVAAFDRNSKWMVVRKDEKIIV